MTYRTLTAFVFVLVPTVLGVGCGGGGDDDEPERGTGGTGATESTGGGGASAGTGGSAVEDVPDAGGAPTGCARRTPVASCDLRFVEEAGVCVEYYPDYTVDVVAQSCPADDFILGPCPDAPNLLGRCHSNESAQVVYSDYSTADEEQADCEEDGQTWCPE